MTKKEAVSTTIFEEAKNYNYEKIKEYILNGGEVNVCDEDGDSLLTYFVEGYYMHGELLTPEEKHLLKEYKDDVQFLCSFVPDLT